MTSDEDTTPPATTDDDHHEDHEHDEDHEDHGAPGRVAEDEEHPTPADEIARLTEELATARAELAARDSAALLEQWANDTGANSEVLAATAPLVADLQGEALSSRLDEIAALLAAARPLPPSLRPREALQSGSGVSQAPPPPASWSNVIRPPGV
ncbi:hypothetical protein [Corynebacterium argentoratense]|uniref:hypothetical protein n=1 Tax=Corynebacterium argentoratense TaxID=42817 RepID=UPI001F360542|nr:hypothetical protein [Corynebacterium argentoratense]MCF1765218.1 hypothetical protein [Corynebacterium argentoratense]